VYYFSNATILDGSGDEPYQGDVLVENDTIKEILPPNSPTMNDAVIIDASGKYVTPGFIDMHGHSDLEVLRTPAMRAKVGQGITTEVAGNCGIGVFPSEQNSTFLKELSSDVLGSYPNVGWQDFHAYRQQWQDKGSGNNFFVLQAHSNLRRMGMTGSVNRAASEEEVHKMCRLLEVSLQQGCLGLSTGLYYAPCIFATNEELLRLLEVVAKHNALFTVHMRCEGSDIVAAVEEVVALAKQTGVKLQISHLKVIGLKNQHLVDEVLSLIDKAKADGVDIRFDQYPYTYGSTSLFSMLPPQYLKLERKELQKVLSDPEQREIIKEQMETPVGWDSLAFLCGWDQVQVLSLQSNPRYSGQTFSQIAKALNSDPYEVFFDLLEQEQGTALMIDVTQSEESIIKIMRHPLMSFGTDALYTEGAKHPRSFQSTFHILDRYGKQLQVLPLPTLISKMTGVSAKRLGLRDRGLIKVGYKADLLLLDWESLHDSSDVMHPDSKSSGLDLVMVNGQIAYKDGEFTGSTSGSLLKRIQ